MALAVLQTEAAGVSRRDAQAPILENVMKIEFRPTIPNDADGVASFLKKVFQLSDSSPLLDRAGMNWKYWSPYPGWEGSRGYVLERDHQIVAHGAVVPQVCLWAGERFPAFHLIDWAAAPDAAGTGTSLFLRLLKDTRAGYVAGGSQATRRLLPALGFRDFGMATRYARPVKPWRRGARSAKDIARIGRSLLWTLQAPAARGSGVTGDVRKIVWPVQRSDTDTIVMERTPELIEHFLKCPLAPMTFHAVEGGYFMLAFAPGQARIVACRLDVNAPEALRSLYLTAAAEAAKHEDVFEVVTIASPSLLKQSLMDAGFHARGDVPLRFYSKAPPLDSATALRFQMLDSDAAYLHSGSVELWT
jgi:hypothetical protein